VEMIVLLKFKVDKDQLKDQTEETLNGMHMMLQKYAQNAVDRAIQGDGAMFVKLVESACAKMLPGSAKKDIGGPPKMTGGEGNGHQ